MNRKMLIALMAVLALAGYACVVLAMGGSHSKEPVGGTNGWPEGLRELVNIDARVAGYFVNADDVFYFRGDPKALTRFLEGYARLKDTPLRLILHPGRGLSRTPWNDPKPESIDWSLTTENRAWRQLGETGKKPTDKGLDVTVHLWLGSTIGLEDLDVPLTIEVLSSQEMEKFIVHHEAKRSLEKESK